MKLVELSVEAFAKQMASDSPAPGGGSAAALVGALSASLCAMVARLTLNRQQYQESWDSMESVRAESDRLAVNLLELVDRDTEEYNRVVASFKMPKETEEQKAARSRAIHKANREAALVPMETLKVVRSLAELVGAVIEKGNPNCITDGGVAAQLILAAATGAAYNVRINLPGIKDKTFADALHAETMVLMEKIETAVRGMTAEVERKLS